MSSNKNLGETSFVFYRPLEVSKSLIATFYDYVKLKGCKDSKNSYISPQLRCY